MTTLQILLSIGLVPFAIALAINLPRLFRAARMARRHALLCAAWIALVMSQARITPSDTASGATLSISAGEFYQLAWLAVAGLLTLLLLLRTPPTGRPLRLPLVALLVYSTLGIATAGFSPFPLLSIYKGSQVLVAAVLAIATYSHLARTGEARLILELIYFLLTLIMVSTGLGGILFPERAYLTLYAGGGGLFGATLVSIVPHLHSNGLGLLAAIVVVVSLRRSFENHSGTIRFYYLSLSLLSFLVLFAAQARTSLVALALALLVMSVVIRRLRWLLLFLILGVTTAASYYAVTGSGLGFEESALGYLRRGQSSEQLKSMSGRTWLWDIGTRMLADAPFVGHGFQTGARFGGLKYGLAEGSNMHSSHIQILVDSGVLGYVSWLAFVIPTAWLALRRLFRIRMQAKTDADRLHIEAALVVLMILVRSFSGHVLVALDLTLLIFIAIFLYASRAGIAKRTRFAAVAYAPSTARAHS